MWEKLWRRTVTLAREYPALWLPVVFAELAGFVLRTKKHAIVLFVVLPLSRTFSGHSVLSGSIGQGDRLTGISVVIGSVIAFAIQFAPIVLYTIAYFVTARMVWDRIGFRSFDADLHMRRNIVALSIRGLLIGCVAWILIGVLSVAYLMSRWHMVGLPGNIFAEVTGAVLMSTFAYLMVPPAMRLLADPAAPPSGRSIGLARKCAIAAVITSTGLMILELVIVGVVHGTRQEIVAIRAIVPVIAALPYVPLYIALSLLVRDEQPVVYLEQAALVPEEGACGLSESVMEAESKADSLRE